MVETMGYKVVGPHEKLSVKIRGQRNAIVVPLESLPQKLPDKKQGSVILCRAEVAFCPTDRKGGEISGVAVCAFGECIHTPKPNCEKCEVFKLEKKLKGRVETVSEEEFDHLGPEVFLEGAGIKMREIMIEELD